MKADAIIFDKDGTLIDFDAFWVTVSVKAMTAALEKLSMEQAPLDRILEAFGIHNGVTDIDGVLCKGTYEQMGGITYDILSEYGCPHSREEVTRVVIESYNENADAGEVKPTCEGLCDVLRELVAEGKKLAVVTTDNELITRKCLKALGIEELFERIYTDDGGFPTKPDPACVLDFCALTGVAKERMVVVGDTMTDVRFARNSGIAVVSLAKTEGNRAVLAPHADKVISEMTSLRDVLQ